MSPNYLSQNAINTYKRLLKSLKPYIGFFVIGIVATLVGSGVESSIAWFIKPLVNKGFIERDLHFIAIVPLVVVGIFILRALTNFMSDYFINLVGRNVVRDYRQRVFKHLMCLPANFYDNGTSGKLLSTIIYNVEQLANACTDVLVNIAREGGAVIGLVAVMFSISWKLALLFFIFGPLIYITLRITSVKLRKLSRGVQKTMAEISHVSQESIEGYRVIRTFGGEDYEVKKFNRATQENRQREMKVIVANSLGSSGVQILISIPIVVILLIATNPHFHMTAGGFASMVTAMFMLLRPIRRLTDINNKIQNGLAGAQSIYELLDTPGEKDTGTRNLIHATGKIEYSSISFTYPTTQREVLHEVSFCANPGETIALVGRSGSGKSTLVSLLPRFYEPQIGKILIDGIDIREYKLADLRHQFSLVSQNVTLFNDTIAHNIAYGSFVDATEEQIIQAAIAAHAMEFIEKLPDGLNTMVGENGVLLSGGQRQRIAIARALLKKAPILILDEATSALDTESERHIQEALYGLMHNCTTLVIAHRLSTIERANRILVFAEGRIVEIGTHHELVKRDGVYARLHKN